MSTTRYIIENYVNRKWTLDEVHNAEKFYTTHNAGYEHFPWPKDLFEKIVTVDNSFILCATPEPDMFFALIGTQRILAFEDRSSS